MAMRKLGVVVLYQPSSCIRHHQGASSKPDFRKFLLQRNRLLLVKKWGVALENHEPYENTRAAVERALARAEIFADRCRRIGNMITERSAWPKSFNAAEQHSRHVKKGLELQEAYATYQPRRNRTFAGKVARSLMGTKLYEPARKYFYSLPDSLRRNFPLE
jgi:hypothetical protein